MAQLERKYICIQKYLSILCEGIIDMAFGFYFENKRNNEAMSIFKGKMVKGTSEIFPTIRLLEERQQFVNKRLSLKLGPQEGKQSVGWNKIQSESLDVCFSHLVFPILWTIFFLLLLTCYPDSGLSKL